MVSVLILGSGGREEAIAWKLSQSECVAQIFICPGNGGTELAKGKIKRLLSVDTKNHDSIVKWCQSNIINLVVIGPENLLADGLSDELTNAGIPCFGPSSKAAQIESSKAFMKMLMDKYSIPTARWKSFHHYQEAQDFINNANFPALVVKASGLAAGKGVIVAQDKQEACRAVEDMLESKIFGDAGSTVVVEELLIGEEISCLAFCDGRTLVSMPPSQDHKRLEEGDRGPNTGGMGAYCPVTKISSTQMQEIERDILKKTLDAMKEEGLPFIGVLYAGLMMTADGPKVLEFNCRFGDPETQVILPILKSDLYPIMLSCVQGQLTPDLVQFETNKYALGIVLASEGYPGDVVKGRPISNTDKALQDLNTTIFYSGVDFNAVPVRETSPIPDRHLVTSGGRVMTVVATSNHSLEDAAIKANKMAATVEFLGKQFRSDIGWRSMRGDGGGEGDRDVPSGTSLTYAGSGVNIEEGDLFVESIKPLTRSTNRIGCMSGIGSFGALFDLAETKYVDPILVSGTDGVGTKLKVAQSTQKHDSIGIDLVAMCVNDVLCHGAEPLFFLDYFSCGRLDAGTAQSVVGGVARGCRAAGCALVGGETAEMPGMYNQEEYDLAGFAVGVVERTHLLPSSTNPIREGDVLIGLSSAGLHSNGYSLVRKVLEVSGISMSDELACVVPGAKTVGDLLLTPTKIYVPHILPLMGRRLIKACAHITGGGLPGNVARVLPEGLKARMDALKWRVPAVFEWLRSLGNIDEWEMLKTFNCGLGMVLIVDRLNVHSVMEELNKINNDDHDNDGVGGGSGGSGKGVLSSCKHDDGYDNDIDSYVVGNVEKASGSVAGDDKPVVVENLLESLKQSWYHDHSLIRVKGKERILSSPTTSVVAEGSRKKVAVLISGSGTNLQALIDDSLKPDSPYQITLVVSNVQNAYGLKRAESANIKTCVINHKDYKSREEFDAEVDRCLKSHDVEFVCLAGFMRILSDKQVKNWKGRMLNIHPSLLPSFKGLHVHRQVLEAGVRVSGCTVHFVSNELDGGAIVAQETVPVMPNDTEDDICERVKGAEHRAYPMATRLLTSGKVKLGDDGKVVWSL